MQAFRFTLAAIAALPVSARRTRYKDTGQEGLIVAVSPGGSRVYYVFKRSRGKLYEERIGLVESLSVEEARRRAREILIALDQGKPIDDLATRKRSGDTFADLWAWWAEHYGKPRRTRWKATEATYATHIAPAIGLHPVARLTRAQVRAMQQRIGASGKERTANIVVGLVRTVINKAITEGRYTGANPAAGIEAFKRPARGRVLSPDEMKRLRGAIAAMRQDAKHASHRDLCDLVELLLYTGQRRGNVLAMRWDQLDLDGGAWTIPRTKAGRVHGVALEAREVEILRARRAVAEALAKSAGRDEPPPWVFPARAGSESGHMTQPSAGWGALLARAGIKDFTMHDLRRTHGSWLLGAGVKLDTISKILDHSSVRVTEEVYAHLDLESKRAAKRQALEAMGYSIDNVQAPSDNATSR